MILEIESPRLKLRDYRLDDWRRVHLYAANPEFSQYDAWGPNSIEDSQKFVADCAAQAGQPERYKYDMAVCLKEKDLFIGGCTLGLASQTSAVAFIGWAINPDFQNQGYATEAAKALIQFGFEKLDLEIIYATCDLRNTPSYRVMEKLGMKRVGLMKAHLMQKGELRDTLRYEISRRLYAEKK